MRSLNINQFQSGIWKEQYEYKSFSPYNINIQWLLTHPKLQTLLGEADRYMGRLDSFADLIPDINFFIKMHVTKEATESNKIEGTQTSFEEALVNEEDLNPEKRDDWHEVHNYIDALNNAIENMQHLPISNRLIKETHRILLKGVRGKEKLPGTYRISQNWIGSSLKNAVFIPPIAEEIADLMQDLENFIHIELLDSNVHVPHLIKIAMIHYQFETIHPFLDGNGRIGRLLITLYFLEKKILTQPVLYLSNYFEKNRRTYYDLLNKVRTDNAMEEWLVFFLEGIVETAKSSIETFQNILKLRNEIEGKQLIKLGRKQADGKKLIDALYKQPILDGMEIAEILKVHPSTANRLIKDFQDLDILRERTGYKRNRIYAFDEYIKLF